MAKNPVKKPGKTEHQKAEKHVAETEQVREFFKKDPSHVEYDVYTKKVMIEFLQNLSAKTETLSKELNQLDLRLPEVFKNTLNTALIEIKELETNVYGSQSNSQLKKVSDNIRTLYHSLNPVLQRIEQQTFEKNQKEMFDRLLVVNEKLINTKNKLGLHTEQNPLVQDFKTVSIKMDELVSRVYAAKNKETLKELDPKIDDLDKNISAFLQKAAVRNAGKKSEYQSINEVIKSVAEMKKFHAEKEKWTAYLQDLEAKTFLLKSKLPIEHTLREEIRPVFATIKAFKDQIEKVRDQKSLDNIKQEIRTFYHGKKEGEDKKKGLTELYKEANKVIKEEAVSSMKQASKEPTPNKEVPTRQRRP